MATDALSPSPQPDDVFISQPQTANDASAAEEAEATDELADLLPAPLSHSTFTSTAFDVNDFLLTHRHVSLDQIRSDLRSYLAQSKTELVGVINRDYEDFIGLGIGLRGTDKRLEDMRRPVEAIRTQVQVSAALSPLSTAAHSNYPTQNIRTDLSDLKADIDAKLLQRAQIRDQESQLKLLLSIHDSVLKVEGLLHIPLPQQNQQSTSAHTQLASPRLGSSQEYGLGVKQLVLTTLQ